MEQYVINGHTVSYDTFDLDEMELFDSEAVRVDEEVKEIAADADGQGGYIKAIRAQCESVLDFFDTVLGENASREIFGGKTNVKTIMEAYKGFVMEVVSARKDLGLSAGGAPAPANREQRRAAERQKRREEAHARVAARQAAVTNDETKSV